MEKTITHNKRKDKFSLIKDIMDNGFFFIRHISDEPVIEDIYRSLDDLEYIPHDVDKKNMKEDRKRLCDDFTKAFKIKEKELQTI